MIEIAGRILIVRTIVEINASGAIVALLVQDETDLLAPKALLCGAIACVAFISTIRQVCLFHRIRDDREATIRLENFGLTPRERETVLEFMAGKSMKEIAIDRGLPYSTVRNDFSAVYRKLGIRGSAQLISLGIRYKIE